MYIFLKVSHNCWPCWMSTSSNSGLHLRFSVRCTHFSKEWRVWYCANFFSGNFVSSKLGEVNGSFQVGKRCHACRIQSAVWSSPKDWYFIVYICKSAIGSFAPDDSGFWWIIILSANTKASGLCRQQCCGLSAHHLHWPVWSLSRPWSYLSYHSMSFIYVNSMES